MFSALLEADFTGPTSVATAAAVVSILVLGRFQKGKKQIVIPDYRRGVRFVDGKVTGVLPAGSYRFDSKKEQITIVDVRPQPVMVERLTFQDAVKTPAVISIASELRVDDPQLACTTLRDHMKDSYAILRDTLRLTVSQQIVQPSENRDALARTLSAEINNSLRKVGMIASPIEITELWAGASNMPIAAPTGVVQ